MLIGECLTRPVERSIAAVRRSLDSMRIAETRDRQSRHRAPFRTMRKARMLVTGHHRAESTRLQMRRGPSALLRRSDLRRFCFGRSPHPHRSSHDRSGTSRRSVPLLPRSRRCNILIRQLVRNRTVRLRISSYPPFSRLPGAPGNLLSRCGHCEFDARFSSEDGNAENTRSLRRAL